MFQKDLDETSKWTVTVQLEWNWTPCRLNSSTFTQEPSYKGIILRTMRSTQHRNQLKYFYRYVSPFGIFRYSKYVWMNKLKLEFNDGNEKGTIRVIIPIFLILSLLHLCYTLCSVEFCACVDFAWILMRCFEAFNKLEAVYMKFQYFSWTFNPANKVGNRSPFIKEI